MKRFQECSKLEQIWRYRWYLIIPIKYIYYSFFKSFKVYEAEFDNEKIIYTRKYIIIKGRHLWQMLLSKAQSKMKWYYTSEEVLGVLPKKVNDLNDNKKEDNISDIFEDDNIGDWTSDEIILKHFEYKNYKGSIEFSEEDNLFYGKIIDINDLVSYEANSVLNLEKSFIEAVKDYVRM